eukprot:scaffold74070_cov67-Attheya_sp.AAC.1
MASGCHLSSQPFMTTKVNRGGIPPAAVLLVCPTGVGKSLVRDTYAAGLGGIHWSISPLLSLTADQESKINSMVIQDDGAIIAVHLDFYRTNDHSALPLLRVYCCFPLPQVRRSLSSPPHRR